MELRDVEHVHLADQVNRHTLLFAALVLVCVLRLVAGALLPLSADEAYYWLWSKHLAAGYYDHPPAIAWLVWAGTAVFGKTAFGVRVAGILLSFAATWFVWKSAEALFADRKTPVFKGNLDRRIEPGHDDKVSGVTRVGLTAALLFNLTLMVTVELLAATPDAPQVVTAAAFFWALTKVAETGNGRWWLAVGMAGGLGLLSKYSTLFLGAGALVWLIACPAMRRWLRSPWPYLGGLIALVLFLPNVLWNAGHGWATFEFQFGRIAGDHLTLKYLGEFLGAQALLASPFVFVLGVAGFITAGFKDKYRALIAALMWPSVVYFLIHTLHDRVQGNWPCYLYPVLVIAALDALRREWTGWRAPVMAWSARLALPVAAVLLVAGYAQALLGVVPMGRKDPLARLLAVGMPEVVEELGKLKTATGAGMVVTTDYAQTAWLAFYSPYPVVSLGEDYRWPDVSPLQSSAYAKPALFITELPPSQNDKAKKARFAAALATAKAAFTEVREIARIDRQRQGIAVAHYAVYRVSGPNGTAYGRMP